uniref:Golgin subfamily A conserved domain-containing protein n=1 Tax=Anopheles melas TaxID=34690 RepID=A0A182TY77_9DIPT
MTAQEFLDRLQEYTDLNTRIHDQQQEQLDKSNLTILHSQYVKITPINPDGGARQESASPGIEGTAAAAAAGGGSPEDATSACHGDAATSGTCCALIFRETTV